MRTVWRRGAVRLVLVSAIAWAMLVLLALAFHLWSCTSSVSFLSANVGDWNLQLISYLSHSLGNLLPLLSSCARAPAALCKNGSEVLHKPDSMGLSSKPLHRCSIPVADDPDDVFIPKRTPNTIVNKLFFITVDKRDKDSPPLFGGRHDWKQWEGSFKLNATMKVHCGFMKNSGADMDNVDVEYIHKCKFVVASGIFDGYDIPHQPSNISLRSQKLSAS